MHIVSLAMLFRNQVGVFNKLDKLAYAKLLVYCSIVKARGIMNVF